jgi:hypothetical protein
MSLLGTGPLRAISRFERQIDCIVYAKRPFDRARRGRPLSPEGFKGCDAHLAFVSERELDRQKLGDGRKRHVGSVAHRNRSLRALIGPASSN